MYKTLIEQLNALKQQLDDFKKEQTALINKIETLKQDIHTHEEQLRLLRQQVNFLREEALVINMFEFRDARDLVKHTKDQIAAYQKDLSNIQMGFNCNKKNIQLTTESIQTTEEELNSYGQILILQKPGTNDGGSLEFD